MKLSSRILINGKVKRFGDIYNLFSKTGYGMILSQRIRWSIYKPQEMSHTAWEQLIGHDANNLKHLLVSYRLTQLFLLKKRAGTLTFHCHCARLGRAGGRRYDEICKNSP